MYHSRPKCKERCVFIYIYIYIYICVNTPYISAQIGRYLIFYLFLVYPLPLPGSREYVHHGGLLYCWYIRSGWSNTALYPNITTLCVYQFSMTRFTIFRDIAVRALRSPPGGDAQPTLVEAALAVRLTESGTFGGCRYRPPYAVVVSIVNSQ